MSTARRALRGAAILALVSLGVVGCDDPPPPLEPGPSREPGPAPPGADVRGPSLVTATFSPKRVNVTRQPGQVEIFARIEDGGSGVERAAVQFKGPGTARISQFTDLRRVSGDPRAGSWEGAVTIPQGARGGTWILLFLRADDRAGNITRYTTDDLRAMGVPVELEVFPR